jgi:hypothetical protein
MQFCEGSQSKQRHIRRSVTGQRTPFLPIGKHMRFGAFVGWSARRTRLQRQWARLKFQFALNDAIELWGHDDHWEKHRPKLAPRRHGR